jgi:xanthine dehydrogenase accessory factor
MRDLAEAVARARATGERVAIARAVSITGFGGRRAGEAVAVALGDGAGALAGSLLGGSADAQVSVAASGLTPSDPAVVIEVPIGDTDAIASGLACGGLARLLVQDAAAIPSSVWSRLDQREPVVLATSLPTGTGTEASSSAVAVYVDSRQAATVEAPQEIATELRSLITETGLELIRSGKDATRLVESDAGAVFFEAFVPPSRLVVVAEPSKLAEAICAQGAMLGWESVVVEERSAALAAVGDLGPRDAFVLLSHDHELGISPLAAALASPAYVGALGSRHTQQARRDLLGAIGIETDALSRIHGPIGLDIGSRSPEETAVSIFAEILAWRSGREARSLREGDGPING